MISSIIIPFFLLWGRLNLIEFSFLQSYYFIATFMLEIPCGLLADRLERKWILAFSGLLSAGAAFIYSIIPNLIMFYIAETLFALASAMMSGSIESFLFDTLKTNRKEKEFTIIIGKSEIYFLIGFFISSPIGSIIGYFFSLPLVMMLMVFPYIGAFLVSLLLVEPKLGKNSKKIKFFSPIKSSFRNFKKNKVLRILIKDMLIIEVFILILFLNYQYYLYLVLDIPILYFGLFDSFFVLMESVFTYIITKYKPKFKKNRCWFSIFTFLPGICYILLGIILFLPINIFLLIIIIGLGLSRYVIFMEGINKRINKENRATSLSIINMIRMLSKGIILPLFALFILWDINFTFIFIGFSIILISTRSKTKKEYL
ncbi:MAG: MFS transporter [Promethearchaeota archaeon]